jgi:hypothetical protein
LKNWMLLSLNKSDFLALGDRKYPGLNQRRSCLKALICKLS